MGAAYLAGLAVGFWSSVDEIQQQWQINRTFQPAETNNTAPLIEQWHRAVKACKAWTEL
jgi:glycerol kinase